MRRQRKRVEQVITLIWWRDTPTAGTVTLARNQERVSCSQAAPMAQIVRLGL